MFPLCERCWSDLTPRERWPYYLALFNSWEEKTFDVGQLNRAVFEEPAYQRELMQTFAEQAPPDAGKDAPK